MQHGILSVISYELTGLGGGLFKEFMHVRKSRTRSSFCTSTRINFSQKHHQEFCYITRENERALHEFSKLYEYNDFTGTVLEVDL
eukprot:COSAG05_NODE_362_length_10792_cov_14.566913_9_plen_85_part_00